MMGLQCKKCGSRNTEVAKARDLAEMTGNSIFLSAASGLIDPTIVIGALKSIFELIGKLFDWLRESERNKGSVVVCKDCGYWERV